MGKPDRSKGGGEEDVGGEVGTVAVDAPFEGAGVVRADHVNDHVNRRRALPVAVVLSSHLEEC
jgi:ABC-type uncharacterized transport system ATPase subunit